jgi:aerobic-type carbon monoxide dehydrogenase small subunit (CoxS/CutS family)
MAVQVGGPSGQMVGVADFEREICFDDLATGGALVVFGGGRDPLEIASQYLAFFIHESCGYCTPCRVGNVLLKERLDRILSGRGEPQDLDYLQALAGTVRTTSRCGLGQTSPNPVLSTLRSFRPMYEARLTTPVEGRQAGFDLAASARRGRQTSPAAGRPSHRGRRRGAMTGPTIPLTVDGRTIQARPGQTILEATDEAGIYVPRLCWLKGLLPFGSCRVCTVRVNGRPQAACTQPVTPGMVVENDTAELAALRRDLIDMLFVEGNHFCMFCAKSGNCELQALAYRFGIAAPRFPFAFPQRARDARTRRS